MREKVGKSRSTVFFQWFGAPEGRKVGSLKRRVRSQLARWVMKNCTPLWREAHFQVKMYIVGPLLEVAMSKKCTPLWREAHFQVKMYKTHQVRTTCGSSDVEKVARRCGAKHISKSKCTKHTRFGTTFGSSDVEKVHAVVARSTFPSQNVQNTPGSDHFWKFRCRESARRCGAKHISKSKCNKTLHVRATFGGSDVEKVHAVVARRTFRSKHVQNSRGSDHFWRFRCRFASIHYTRGHYTTLHSSTLHYTTLHSSTLHYIQLHYTTLHYTEWHCNTDRQVDS